MTIHAEEVTREFHRLYYERGLHADHGRGLHSQTLYHGVEAHKCPLDLWIFQEIIHEVRPALIIELGTYRGGTTLFLAHQLELLGNGRVVSIDMAVLQRPPHARIRYLTGTTSELAILAQVRDLAGAAAGGVLLIHDANHHYDHVVEDLDLYHSLVTPGSYFIVEDTNVNGHPVLADWGAGPWEAVEQFLSNHSEFERDFSREKFLLTYNPGGYLRRRHP